MPSTQSTAQQLREALHPIWRRLTADRTISVGKIGILADLAKRGPMSASTLASSQKVSPQAITTAARELEALELIIRTPDENDRRRTWIDITEAGRVRLAKERAIGADWLQEAITARLDTDEQKALEALIPILHKLVADDSLD